MCTRTVVITTGLFCTLFVLWGSVSVYAFTEYDHSEFDHPVGQWETDAYGQLDYDADADPAATPSVYKSDDYYPTTENYYRGAEYDYEDHQESGH